MNISLFCQNFGDINSDEERKQYSGKGQMLSDRTLSRLYPTNAHPRFFEQNHIAKIVELSQSSTSDSQTVSIAVE